MQEIIERLNNQPQATSPAFEAGLNTWLLLDKVRGGKTLASLYQDTDGGLITHIDCLVMGTEYAYLHEESPLLIKLSRTVLSETIYQNIQAERSGIFIQAKDPNILPHLQYLFTMQTADYPKVFARYYDPIFWTALQLSLPEQQQAVWGNLQKVYAQAPNSHQEKLNFMEWSAPAQQQTSPYTVPTAPIKLNTPFTEISETLKLLSYVIYPVSYQQTEPLTAQQLTNSLANLKDFNQAGIEQIDYLQRLLPFTKDQLKIIEKPEIAAILNTDVLDYEKIAQIEATMKEQHNG